MSPLFVMFQLPDGSRQALNLNNVVSYDQYVGSSGTTITSFRMAAGENILVKDVPHAAVVEMIDKAITEARYEHGFFVGQGMKG